MKKIGLLPRIILAIFAGVVIGSFMPGWFVRIFATFNEIFGNFLEFAIPLIILAFIAPGIGEIGKGAGKYLGLTTALAYGSTAIAGLLAYLVAHNLYPVMLNNSIQSSAFENPEKALLKPFLELEIPAPMEVMTALVLAFTLGLGMAAIKNDSLKK